MPSACRANISHLFWRIFILSAWIGIQAYLFVTKYLHILKTPSLVTFRGLAGPCLPLARASAICINFNSAIIIFMCCRVSITWLRSTSLGSSLKIPFDDAIEFHKIIGYAIGLLSILHSCAHYVNISHVSMKTDASPFWLAFASGPGLTGHLLLLFIFLMLLTAGPTMIREKAYELFFLVHKLSYLYYVTLCIHGMFCFIKTDIPGKPCIAPTSWIWVTPSLVLFILEMAYTTIRALRFTYVSKVILHQSKVYEIQIRKPSFTFLPGQYMLVKIPAASWLQWHPFTITSAPEEDYISIHVRTVGNWTRDVAHAFGIKQRPGSNEFGSLIERPQVMPRIWIDGPYGAPCQDFSKYEVIVCIGAGIGQTPFSSVLRSIWYTIVHPTEDVLIKKLLYIGICRSVLVHSTILPVEALEAEDTGHFLDIRCFFTGPLSKHQIHQVMNASTVGLCDPITGLRSPTYFGRPNFENILGEIKQKYELCSIGVFYCGPHTLAVQMAGLCSRLSDAQTKISFHKEHF